MRQKFDGQAAAVLRHLDVLRSDFAIALLVTLLGLTLFAFMEIRGNRRAGFSFLENIELRSLDARFQLRGVRPHDDRIAIVGIDEKTLHKIGSFPIARSAYAALIDKLAAGGAKVVAFDVDFPTPEKNSAVEALKRLETAVAAAATPAVIEQIRQIERTSDNDAILAESMKNANTVILGHLFLDRELAQAIDSKEASDYFDILAWSPFPQVRKAVSGRDFDLSRAWSANGGDVAQGVEPNIRLLAESAKSFGFFDQNPDLDGTIRRAVLIIRYRNEDFFPSLAFQTVREFENLKDETIVAWLSENGLERIEYGSHRLTTGRDGTALINYSGPYRTYRHYSMADVIEGTVPAQTFMGKIVLVGATAKGIGDIRQTPFPHTGRAYMGVEIQANIIDNLLHSNERGRGFLARGLHEEMIDLAFILTFGMGLGLLFAKTRPAVATVSVMAALLCFGIAVCYAFDHWGMWLNFTLPAGTLMLNYAGITSYRVIFEERQKRKIRKQFEQYLSPDVIRLIQKDPQRYLRPGGETKELSVMFSDIRSFTTISEGLTASELVLLLNEYLGEMTEILFQTWGTLDKYIGDAIMAFWGSPIPQEDHARRACACALQMKVRLEKLNRKWEAQGREPWRVGIGINTGPVCVGNMGSSRRLAWTVMGDNVNLASRLEGLTKEYQVQIVISENTYQEVAGEYVCRELDLIRVKGKQQPVAVYELMAHHRDAEKYADLLARFTDARSSYQARRWQEAIRKFEDLLQLYPDDGPSHMLLRRLFEYRTEAPAPEWDGVYVMEHK